MTHEEKIRDAFTLFGMDNIKVFFISDSEIDVHALMPTSDYYAHGVRFRADLSSDDDGVFRFYRILNKGEMSEAYIGVPY